MHAGEPRSEVPAYRTEASPLSASRWCLWTLAIAVCMGGCDRSPSSTSRRAGDEPASRSATAPVVGDSQHGSRPSRPNADSGTGTGGAFSSTTDRRPGTPAASKQPGDEPADEPQPIFRPSDRRPRHDAARLATLGILEFESKRLKLYTDVDPEVARTLPPVIDQAYAAWEAYFGPLPPNREGTEYQMTGYLMADRELFHQAGLLPDDLPPFVHARHRGDEFWMHEQDAGYYRRHLMIHESTHCFMTTLPDGGAPVWYMEGMAELFGTHVLHDDGTITFGVMPHNDADFRGLGRIRMIRNSVAGGRVLSLESVAALTIDDYTRNEAYAWSWGLSAFLDAHPRYRERFRQLGRQLPQINFQLAFGRRYEADLADLRTEWLLFATGLEYGYDVARAAVDFRPGTPLTDEAPERSCQIDAGRSWQSSGVRVIRGERYDIRAAGETTLGNDPQPWLSEPQGISIYYSQGRPIGTLIAAVRADAEPSGPEGESMLESIGIGRGAELAAPATGTLYFRVNDFWRSLADNSGSLQVTIRRLPAP